MERGGDIKELKENTYHSSLHMFQWGPLFLVGIDGWPVLSLIQQGFAWLGWERVEVD